MQIDATQRNKPEIRIMHVKCRIVLIAITRNEINIRISHIPILHLKLQ